ncbi:alpha/beta hydrolase [Pendulispora albinea]|uniref:Esterase family protein n=1 Tax=Pendulispora albinea TaxID=2741071 RepID=A0ABZ2LUT5_9BACT
MSHEAYAGADEGEEAFPPAVVDEQPIAPRIVDLTIDSRALRARTKVRLILPKRFYADARRRWPVLYLLYGCCDDYTAWTRETDIAALTANTDVLVVMPEADRVGWYSNWWNHGRGGPPGWETFHLTEVRSILERSYRASGRRAIAGLSMGGFGALSYVARHPGMFSAAASFSGVIDTRFRDTPKLLQELVAAHGRDPLALWGDPKKQEWIWRVHNPADLAFLLLGTPLYISCGNGKAGPLDPPGQPDDPNEVRWNAMNVEFAKKLRFLGANVRVNLYGPGTHTWPYWQREMHIAFPMLMRAIGA